jgi:hypothetical protein
MDIRTQIQTKREDAAKARRLATALSERSDIKKLLDFAAELEAQADALERSLPPAPPQVTQVQMQVQNQQATPPKKPKDEPESR